MPVENERKFVLTRSKELYQKLKSEGITPVEVFQGYLVSSHTRVRKIIHAPNWAHVYTAKFPVEDELIEIETTITAEDYEKLWSVSFPKLRKERFNIDSGDEHWDVDFYIDGGEVYISMAECEMPVGRSEPISSIDLLQKYILYNVPKSEQEKYSAYELADPAKGKKLLKELEIKKTA